MTPPTMNAMVFDGRGLLRLTQLPVPRPRETQILIRVAACGVCRTDLHIVDGDLTQPKLPLIPGHEIVGEIVELGAAVTGFRWGERVGVPWLGRTCGRCAYCKRGQENLCDAAEFTGYSRDGGYAEFAVAEARYCFPVATELTAVNAAPLLCAGLIGYRAYRQAGADAQTLGFYGFGAAAHILIQLAVFQHKAVYAFTRRGDEAGQRFARRLGAVWAGGSDELPPEPLDAAIIFAPVGALVPAALRAVHKGGAVICAGIHMSEIPAFPYALLWGERRVQSVANLTRRDGEEFLPLAAAARLTPAVEVFPLAAANEALSRLRTGQLTGAGVLNVGARE